MENTRPAFKGTHLIVDGSVVDEKAFEKKNLRNMIKALVKELGMYIIFGPVFKAVDPDPTKLNYTAFADSGGVSAFCMISTSHLSIHCFELTKTFQMDAFSCKTFDAAKALDIIKQYLNINELKVQVVERTQLDYS